MSDRQKTRARPTRRHTFAPSYGAILEEGVRRRSVLKGFLAAMGAAALSPALGTAHAEAAGSSLTFPELSACAIPPTTGRRAMSADPGTLG
ncbi:hypothetical protein [Rhizobium leguminosarum]|uniref:hypothetical protein n=1 Tax=Rhizobium leguminosarum TaxID=384 RepID=UPI0021BC04AC|nr:hypothetical protein [Rhizobium leguminosarum]